MPTIEAADFQSAASMLLGLHAEAAAIDLSLEPMAN
jgi:hypothetical protein